MTRKHASNEEKGAAAEPAVMGAPNTTMLVVPGPDQQSCISSVTNSLVLEGAQLYPSLPTVEEGDTVGNILLPVQQQQEPRPSLSTLEDRVLSKTSNAQSDQSSSRPPAAPDLPLQLEGREDTEVIRKMPAEVCVGIAQQQPSLSTLEERVLSKTRNSQSDQSSSKPQAAPAPVCVGIPLAEKPHDAAADSKATCDSGAKPPPASATAPKPTPPRPPSPPSSHPGAFPGSSSAACVSNPDDEHGAPARPAPPTDTRPPRQAESESNNANLIEATPVSTEPNLAEADPVDLEAAHARASARREAANRRTKFMMAYGIGCFLAGLIVGLVIFFVATKSSDQEDTPKTKAPTNNKTIVPGETMDLLSMMDLPDYTLQAIQDAPESPQAKAYNWMLQDPNLANYTQDRLYQRFALATIFHATNGSRWTFRKHWLSYDHHECLWFFRDQLKTFGRKYTQKRPCGSPDENNDDDGRGDLEDHLYRRLWLSNNTLQGTIPEEIVLLSTLESLDFSKSNHLTGTVPTRLAQLSKLDQLSLQRNSLSGTVPTELGRLKNLTSLFLAYNKFHSTIPSELMELPELEQLTLFRNSFTGSIPSNVANLQSIRVLSLNHIPMLSGPIPSEVGLLSSLVFAYWSFCSLSGSIPSEIGSLHSTLSWLHLQGNQLSGPIASEMGRLTTLSELTLHSNRLTSSIPSELGLLVPSLYLLDLSNNSLTGTIPFELANATSEIDQLFFEGNNFTSPVPTTECEQCVVPDDRGKL